MSSVLKPIRKIQDATVPKFLRKTTQGLDIGRTFAKMADPQLPAIDMPMAPTIDDAQLNRNQQDRLRRRRGVLANIFGGAGSGAGTSSTLGG